MITTKNLEKDNEKEIPTKLKKKNKININNIYDDIDEEYYDGYMELLRMHNYYSPAVDDEILQGACFPNNLSKKSDPESRHPVD